MYIEKYDIVVYIYYYMLGKKKQNLLVILVEILYDRRIYSGIFIVFKELLVYLYN